MLFLAAVGAGILLWEVFALFKTEPWDGAYGWVAIAALGFAFGYIGPEKPLLWPVGLFVGQALSGFASLFFHSGGGVNFFFPLGLIFLVPFTAPALVTSLAAAEIRKERRRTG